MRTSTSLLVGTVVSLSACADPGHQPAAELSAQRSALAGETFAITDHAEGAAGFLGTNPSVAFGGGGYLASWFTGGQVRFNGITSEGESLGGVGSLLSNGENTSSGSRMVFDGQSFRVLWEGWLAGSHNQYGAHWTRLSSDGTRLDDVWVDDLGSSLPARGTVACDGAEGCILVEPASSDGAVPHPVRVLRVKGAQRLDAEKVELPGTGNATRVAVADDGEAYVAVWSTARLVDADNIVEDLHALRIPREGPITAEAVDIGTSTPRKRYAESRLAMAANGASVLLAFEASNELLLVQSGDEGFHQTYRGPSGAGWQQLASSGDSFLLAGHQLDVNGRKLGLKVLEVSSDGVPDLAHIQAVGPASYDGTLSLTGDEHGYLLAASQTVTRGDDTYGGHTVVRYVPLDLHGGLRGPKRSLARSEIHQDSPAMAWNGQDYLAAWIDNRDDWDRLSIQAKHVSAAGEPSDGPAILLHQGTDLEGLVISASAHGYLLAWEERSPGYRRVVVKAVDKEGHELSAPAVISIDQFADSPDIATDGENYMLVWVDNLGDDVYGLLLDGQGARLSSRFPIGAVGSLEGGSPKVAWNGTHYMVAWRRSLKFDNYDIAARSITPKGDLLSETLSVSGDADLYSFDKFAMACAPQVCTVAFTTWSSGAYVQFEADGTPRGAAHDAFWGIDASDDTSTIDMTWDGSGFTVITQEKGAVAGKEQLAFSRISRAGEELAALAPAMTSDLATKRRPHVAADGRGHLLLAYEAGPAGRIEAILLPRDEPAKPDAGPIEAEDAGVDAAPSGDGDEAEDAGHDAAPSTPVADAGHELPSGDQDAGVTPEEPIDEPSDEPSDQGDEPNKPHSKSGCSLGTSNAGSSAPVFVSLALAFALRRRRAGQRTREQR